MTRFHGADPIYDGIHAGISCNVSVENFGLVLRAQVRAERESEADTLPVALSEWEFPKFVGYRYLHDICADRPAFNDLVAHGSSLEVGPIWAGPAALDFYDAENEEVRAFQPLRVAGGWCFTVSARRPASVSEVIHRYRGQEAFSHVSGETGTYTSVAREHAMPYPVTARGGATLASHFSDPSHRLAGNMIVVDFDADPAVVREYVPQPLELDGSGRVYLWTYDGWVYSDRTSTEFVSENRANYAETFFMIPCTFEGELYHYMLYSWVTRDWLAYRGRRLGMPHKVADVQVTRFHPSEPLYHGPGANVRVCVAVECTGLVLRQYVDLQRESNTSELPFPMSNTYCPRFLGWRHYHDVVEDRPALNDLVRHWGDDLDLGPVWTGPAGLEFFDAENEEVLPFQPVRIRAGWFFTLFFRHTESKPEVLYRYGEDALEAAFPAARRGAGAGAG
jgi:acetoacetate decarboxylase